MPILALHGGAGGDGPWRGMTPMDPQRIACMEAVLHDLGPRLEAGELDALTAVRLAVEALEDEPGFNAGVGSVLDADGRVSMDASIMRGQDGAAGSVVGVTNLRHPIQAAHGLLQQGWPAMMAGPGAEAWAHGVGIESVDPDSLITDLRTAQWKKWRDARLRPGATDEDDAALDHDLGEEVDGPGTVGAVALDAHGHLAAATSTGGMTGKPPGRVGDTPVIGAGTWADKRVAVSCTGVGEAYLCACAAHEVGVGMRQVEADLAEVCDHVLDLVEPLGGRGGLIAVSADGQVALPFRVTLMYRGLWRHGAITTGIGPDR
ncbi:MAG TPA: isoaspartyl peptidase/L-asparaginase [Candidatus Poseidoniaceae archaeon]|nr:MAG TPA: beta-aspartyl-peptidase [Candidatus Poseidoniales archaeon]HII97017.1 isoaspartyl peptidase/L-asparaginase [Candidatus Poseidoniaceae archaeon]